jgi:protein involved in polysaccharide export with SLBB domain
MPRQLTLTNATGGIPDDGGNHRLTARATARLGWLLCLWACATSSGCMALLSPINGIPAHRLPAQFHAPPKNNLVPIDISRLRQEAPQYYLVDTNDILGVYIEGALGNPEEPPPVNAQVQGSDLPPSIGYPIVVREDGTISLPLVPPLPVRGLTLGQVENAMRRSYTVDRKILAPGKDRIIVTLLRPREISVMVMRQDGAQELMSGGGPGQQRLVDLATKSEEVKLKAYENDVMHALAATGGLPGFTAKNEVKILRSSAMDAQKRDAFVKAFYQQPGEPCLCRPPLPDDPAIVKIPLRLPPGVTPMFRQQDIVLNEGDIVLIESREREVFYTGGLMRGGEWPLPRDYDLDVLGAMAIAGTGIGGPIGSGGGGGGGGFSPQSIGGAPPGMLYILRKTPCGDQITIAVDLNRAINSAGARPLVQAGDILILRYKCEEEALNFGLGTFFIAGVQRLFQGNR